MTSVNTNILSQIAENNLNNTQNSLTQAVTQLSSGLKINSAADDPAGQAIAVSLQSQINGQNQAISNANNGISLAQTGESALTQITNNLQTIRTLAVQSANGNYSLQQRQSLQQQVSQAISQIDTIAQTTQFNGQNLLDGTFGSANFQVGADAGQTVNVNLTQGVKANQIGQTAAQTLTLTGTGLSATNLGIQVGTNSAVTIGAAVASANAGVAGNAGYGQAANSAYAAAQAINNSDISGLTATATNVQNFNVSSAALQGTDGQSVNLTINGTQVFGSAGYTFSSANSDTLTIGDTINAINAVTSQTGVSASLASDGTLQLTAADGSNITVSQTADAAGDKILSGTGGAALGTALQGSINLSAASAITVSGAGAADLQVSAAVAATTATSGTSTGSVDLNTAVPTITTGTNDTLSVSVDGGAAQTITLNTADTTTAALLTDINGQLTGATASIDATTGGLVITSATTGANSSVSAVTGDGAADFVGTSTTVAGAAGVAAQTAVTVASDGGTIGLGSTGVANIDITTVAGATTAIQTVDAAIAQVSQLQGQLGAVQNRFTSTIANLTSSTQNATSAQSTVQDADFAAASTQLSRANVLSQAATAMIAQANQQPQQVLKLLQ